MSVLPSVDVTVKTRSLGLQDPSQGDALAIVGPAPSSSIAVNTPLLYGRDTDVAADHVDGPLVEAAAIGLAVTGRPVVLVRCATTTAGAMGSIDVSNVTGTAVPVATSGAEPTDDFESEVVVVDGGTIGTDGITYQWSNDGSRTMSPKTALGTGTVIAPEGGVSFTLDPAPAQVTAFIALAVECRTDTLAHLADVTAHDSADTSSAQVALAASSAPTTGAQARAVMNLCRLALAAHESNITVHKGPDPVNVVSHAAATNDSSGIGLALEYKGDFNAHLGIALASSTAGLKAATATVASVVVWTAADDLLVAGVALLDAYPRRPSFTTAGVTASDAPASVLIEGFDLLDAAQSETLNLSQTAGTVTATKAYKGTGLKYTFPAADGTGATIAAGYDKGVHNSADVTNVLTSTSPAQGTLAAGDTWTCRTTMPAPNDAQLDAALLALQQSGYTWKTLLNLTPVGNVTASALKTRWSAMFSAYKYKKFFGHFRMPNIGESEPQYLAAYKAAFDTILDFYGMAVSAGSFECQSLATRPRIYRRPPSWMAAALHVALGPAESLAAVKNGDGAWQYGATIKDANQNPKHHDEDLNPGLDAARALTVRSMVGYPGKVFVTRARTLATLGTDFMWIHYWAAMVEVLDVAIPMLIGQIQAKSLPDVTTGRIAAEAANDIEALVLHEIDAKVTAKGVIVKARVAIDRTVNVYRTPKIPVTITAIPFFYPDGFSVTAALENPSYSNA